MLFWVHGRALMVQDMTKFDNKDNAGYRLVLGELRRWVKELQLALSTAVTQTADG